MDKSEVLLLIIFINSLLLLQDLRSIETRLRKSKRSQKGTTMLMAMIVKRSKPKRID